MTKRILVVDDEPETVELVAFNLKAEGYEVVTADNGWSAVEQARELLPDLIILDLMLPELDGFTVCETLQKQPATARIPIIMLTAWSSELSRIVGLESGAKDYMTKPFSPRELVLRVKNVLSSREPVHPRTKTRSAKTGA